MTFTFFYFVSFKCSHIYWARKETKLILRIIRKFWSHNSENLSKFNFWFYFNFFWSLIFWSHNAIEPFIFWGNMWLKFWPSRQSKLKTSLIHQCGWDSYKYQGENITNMPTSCFKTKRDNSTLDDIYQDSCQSVITHFFQSNFNSIYYLWVIFYFLEFKK